MTSAPLGAQGIVAAAQPEISIAENARRDVNLLLLPSSFANRSFLRAFLVAVAVVLASTSAPAEAQEEIKTPADSVANPTAVKKIIKRLEQTQHAIDRLVIDIKVGNSAFVLRQKAKKSLDDELAAMEKDVHSTYDTLNKADKQTIDGWLRLNLLPKIAELQHLIELAAADGDDSVKQQEEGEESASVEDSEESAEVKPAEPRQSQAPQPEQKIPGAERTNVAPQALVPPSSSNGAVPFWFVAGPSSLKDDRRAVPASVRDWVEHWLLGALAECGRPSPFPTHVDVALSTPTDTRLGFTPVAVATSERGPKLKYFQCVAGHLRLPVLPTDGTADKKEQAILDESVEISVVAGRLPKLDDGLGSQGPPAVSVSLPEACTKVSGHGLCGTLFVGMPIRSFNAAIGVLGKRWKFQHSFSGDEGDPNAEDDYGSSGIDGFRGTTDVFLDGRLILRASVGDTNRIGWISMYAEQFVAANGLSPGMELSTLAKILGNGFTGVMQHGCQGGDGSIRLSDQEAAGIQDRETTRLRAIYIDAVAPQYFQAVQAEQEVAKRKRAAAEQAEAAQSAKRDRVEAERNFSAFPATLQRCRATIAGILSAFSAERAAGERGAVRAMEAAVKRQENGRSNLLALQSKVQLAIEFAKTEKDAARAAEAMSTKAADCLAGRGPSPKIVPHFYRMPRGRYRR